MDLAAELGVSKMTVSLALRDDPSISQEMRDKIKALADMRGYRPDPALGALAAYRRTTRAIGYHGTLVWLNTARHLGAERIWPVLRRFFHGAERRAGEFGYQLDAIWAREPGLTTERLRRILESRNTTGVIVQPQEDDPVPFEVDFRGMSVIRIGDETAWPVGYDLVKADHQWAMERVMEEVALRGYRKAGFVTSLPFEDRQDRAYLAIYLGHSSRWSLEWLPPACVLSKEEFYAWFFDQKPDVLILPDRKETNDLPKWLAEAGVRVPLDVGVVMLSVPTHFGPEWTGVDERYELIGVKAVEYLVSQIHCHGVGLPTAATRHAVQGIWREGRTLRKRTDSKRRR